MVNKRGASPMHNSSLYNDGHKPFWFWCFTVCQSSKSPTAISECGRECVEVQTVADQKKNYKKKKKKKENENENNNNNMNSMSSE